MKKILLALVLAVTLGLGTGLAYADNDNNYNADSPQGVVNSGDGNTINTGTIDDHSIGSIDDHSIGSITNEEQRELPNVPGIRPYQNQLLDLKIGDYTGSMPNFAYTGLKPLRDEAVLEVVTFNGYCLDRIRLEDLEIDLIKYYKETVVKKNWNPRKMRYRVYVKESVSGWGTGGGANGVISGLSGNSGGGGGISILPSYSSTTADPAFVIKFYLVE